MLHKTRFLWFRLFLSVGFSLLFFLDFIFQFFSSSLLHLFSLFSHFFSVLVHLLLHHFSSLLIFFLLLFGPFTSKLSAIIHSWWPSHLSLVFSFLSSFFFRPLLHSFFSGAFTFRSSLFFILTGSFITMLRSRSLTFLTLASGIFIVFIVLWRLFWHFNVWFILNNVLWWFSSRMLPILSLRILAILVHFSSLIIHISGRSFNSIERRSGSSFLPMILNRWKFTISAGGGGRVWPSAWMGSSFSCGVWQKAMSKRQMITKNAFISHRIIINYILIIHLI